MGEDNSEVKITREALFNILMSEKNNRSLQKLSPSFFADTVNYTKEKQQMLKQAMEKEDEFSSNEKDMLKIQIDNIKHILRSIYDYRERKIVNMAIDKSRAFSMPVNTSMMLPEEIEMFNELVNIIQTSRKSVLLEVLSGRYLARTVLNQSSSEEKNDQKNDESLAEQKQNTDGCATATSDTMKLCFLMDVPKFISKDMKMFGPFLKDDSAELPKGIGTLLISKGKAKLVDV